MWKFELLTPGQPERDPHEAEFFNVGRLNYASALIREAIQNSLDAHTDDRVTVKFSLGSQHGWVKSGYCDGLLDHLKACDLYPESADDKVSYLRIEDFGTSGLDGPIDSPSNFFNFWWREGISGKQGGRAGRWGLGKTIYYVASSFRCYFGLTVRSDDKAQLLLGKAVLKTHQLRQSKYHDYGYFNPTGYKPVDDPSELDKFRRYFHLEREDRPGLSLVIPAPKELSLQALIGEGIVHYFFPIMQDKLVLEFGDATERVTLDKETLGDVARAHDWAGTEWEERAAEIESLLAFLEDAATKPEKELIVLREPSPVPRMSDAMLGDDIEAIRQTFNEGKLLWLRVPVSIMPKDGLNIQSFFEVFLQKDESLRQPDEFYVRSGIRISDIHTIVGRSVRALLSADDAPVAAFLGDSESPAHTNWNERTEEFSKKYFHSRDTLRFIKFAARDLVRMLDRQPAEKDPDLLKSIFSVPVSVHPPPPPRLVGENPRFSVSRVSGGFTLTPDGLGVPINIRVRVAYDIRRGNPFSRYSALDFDLRASSILKKVSGGQILGVSGNEISVAAVGPDFKLTITGFDERRDLRVAVQENKT